MSKLKFTEEMFISFAGALTPKGMGDRAQQIFNEWLEKQTVVYGKHPDLAWYVEHKQFDSTHKAYLVCIEDIKEYEHKEVQIYDLTLGNPAFRCVACKKVQPKNGWEEI